MGIEVKKMFMMMVLAFTIPFSSVIDVADYDNGSFNQCVYRLVSEGLKLEYERTESLYDQEVIKNVINYFEVGNLIWDAEIEGEATKHIRMAVLWKDNEEYKVSYVSQNLWYSIRIKKVIEKYSSRGIS
jgi:hypothetical protein